jgi:molecular chaperone GrpE
MDKRTLRLHKKSSEDKRLLTKKKYDDLENEFIKERTKAEEYLKKLQYIQAEFENYQRRVKKEIEYAIKEENEKLVLKIITILDELEIALDAGKKAPSKDVMLEGLDMIVKKFKKMLVNEGLHIIEAVGKPFDPNFHEVITQVQTNDYPEGIIVEEFKKGYMFHGKVIRPSVVSIAKA